MHAPVFGSLKKNIESLTEINITRLLTALLRILVKVIVLAT